MTLRQFTRIIKISAIGAGLLSILFTAVWITVRLLLLQSKDRNDCSTVSSLKTTSSTFVISTGKSIDSISTDPLRDFTTENNPCRPHSIENSDFTPEDTFIFTVNIIYAVLYSFAQIWLYCAVNHRSIRKTQIFILFTATTTIINAFVTTYLLIRLKPVDFTITSWNTISGSIQLYLVHKFLGFAIASSPLASLVPSTDGDEGGQEPEHQVNS